MNGPSLGSMFHLGLRFSFFIDRNTLNNKSKPFCLKDVSDRYRKGQLHRPQIVGGKPAMH